SARPAANWSSACFRVSVSGVTWSRSISTCSSKPLECSIANGGKRRVRRPRSARDGIEAKVVPHGRKLAVIGLGYVGLPVAVAFGGDGTRVIGFDIDSARIAELKAGRDRTCEVEPHDLARSNLVLTSDPGELNSADFFIVTVPTPIDQARRPDLTALLRASSTVGKALKKGDIVVYESTVYPGATEEECVPVLEQVSGLLAGRDFTVGYSPEPINPGDKAHRFHTTTKAIAAQDPRTLDTVAPVYASVITAGLHKAPSIKVAEAAKVIENAQRDLNIAFMNELSAIFHALDIDTKDVLSAAGTKWNFLNFNPCLDGRHITKDATHDVRD